MKSAPARSTDPPTVQDVIAIATDETRSFAEEADEIAWQYHTLALAMAKRVGKHDLNWCGYAQWTSKAIGFSLRLDDDAEFWTRARRAFSVPSIFGGAFRIVIRILLGGSYAKGLSVANRSIFLEMGTLYASLLEPGDGVACWQNGAAPVHSFDHQLITQLTEKQEDLLKTAAHLFQAAESATGDERSQLILGANIALSAHEQARAQGALAFVLYRPVRFITRVAWRLPIMAILRKKLSRFEIYIAPHDTQPRLVRWLEERWSQMYVKVLSLEVPGSRVGVGRRLVPPELPHSHMLSVTLNGPAADLVREFHPDPARRLDGVKDWLDYEERMRFIVSYFMAYQRAPDMFDPPFPKRPRLGRRLMGMMARSTSIVARKLRLPKMVDPAFEDSTPMTVEPRRVVLVSA